MANEKSTEKKSNKKTTAEWLEYYVAKARDEGWTVNASMSRLVSDDEERLGQTEGKTL